MKEARGRFDIAVVKGKVYAIGGSNGTTELATVEKYDPQEQKWTQITPLPLARCNIGKWTVSQLPVVIYMEMNCNLQFRLYVLLGEVKDTSCTVCLYVVMRMVRSKIITLRSWKYSRCGSFHRICIVRFLSSWLWEGFLQTVLKMEIVSAPKCDTGLPQQHCCKWGHTSQHSCRENVEMYVYMHWDYNLVIQKRGTLKQLFFLSCLFHLVVRQCHMQLVMYITFKVTICLVMKHNLAIYVYKFK
jgi:hypothetical protein